ncbi:MAG: hypothetical protein NTW17_01935 [Candidatus Pacearchaeota archaeon]|nr:hypothetical protein [Candidatus Pacearchaeota archaeon]
MKIAIDIDGVLADLMPSLNDFYNQKYRANFKIEDYKHHDLDKTWECSKEDAAKIIEEFYYSPDFLRVTPIEHSQEGILNLSKKHILFLITSRPLDISAQTEKFIQDFFEGQIEKIIYTGQYNLPAKDIDKKSICILEKADVLVEDCFETAIDCANYGIKVFLLGKPWIKYPEESDNLIIVQNWQEILQKLK